MDDNIYERLIELVNSIIKDVNITIEDKELDLISIGMDSIIFVQIIVGLENTFSIEIEDEYFLTSKLNTIEKMVKMITNAVN